MIIAGIDPGVRGAFALRVNGKLMDIIDMPVIEEMVGRTKRKRVVAALVAAELRKLKERHQAEEIYLVCEKVGPTPRDGVAGAFAFGYGAGIIAGVAAGLALPFTLVTPQAWQKAVGASSDKDGNRARACQLYPSMAANFARKQDDGRADAVLIAHYYASMVE